MTILDTIVETKRKEVAIAKQRRPLDDLQAAVAEAEPPRAFAAAVTAESAFGVNLIAELKKASPSAGLIVPDFDPVAIARIYADHGAVALSVLTDETYFQGRLEYISQVRAAVALPILRKDFMVDAYQVYESRAFGADAILLIAEVLSGSQVAELASLAVDLGMGVLVEVHGEASLAVVLEALGDPGPDRYVLGINNRDLTVQRTDLATMKRLGRTLPAGTRFVAESGISTREDVLQAVNSGACAMLVGEALLRAGDVGTKVDELLGRAHR